MLRSEETVMGIAVSCVRRRFGFESCGLVLLGNLLLSPETFLMKICIVSADGSGDVEREEEVEETMVFAGGLGGWVRGGCWEWVGGREIRRGDGCDATSGFGTFGGV